MNRSKRVSLGAAQNGHRPRTSPWVEALLSDPRCSARRLRPDPRSRPSSRAPKSLPDEVTLASPQTRAMWIALALQKPHPLRPNLGRNRDQQVHVVLPEGSFFDTTLFLARQIVKHGSQLLPQFLKPSPSDTPVRSSHKARPRCRQLSPQSDARNPTKILASEVRSITSASLVTTQPGAAFGRPFAPRQRGKLSYETELCPVHRLRAGHAEPHLPRRGHGLEQRHDPGDLRGRDAPRADLGLAPFRNGARGDLRRGQRHRPGPPAFSRRRQRAAWRIAGGGSGAGGVSGAGRGPPDTESEPGCGAVRQPRQRGGRTWQSGGDRAGR